MRRPARRALSARRRPGSLRWLLPLLPILLGPTAGPARADGSGLALKVDWAEFLGRHDLIWKRVPGRWEEGAFLGNGLLGAMVFAPEKQLLAFQLGRSDVTDHRQGREPILARPRLPIGRFEVRTAGALTGGEARLGLWDAEWRATLRTERGSLAVRSYVHAERPVLLIELAPAGGERAAQVVFQPALAINERLLVRPVPLGEGDLNPAPFVEERGPVRVSVQRRSAGGEWAVAWQQKVLPGGRRWIVVSVADSFPDNRARDEAAQAVAAAVGQGAERLRRTHQAFWHSYYPQSFLSLPHPRIESFYWIQMYKLASATRADRPAIDTLGPWYERTPWPGVWWNLNIQLSYWPVYAANRLSLGESLLAIVDDNQANLRNNVPAPLRGDAMAVGRMGGPDAVSPVTYTGPRGPKNGAHELSNLIWVMHNHWLHWRHTLDEDLRRRLYPLLAAAVAYVVHRLAPGPDGKLHLPEAVSPEFPETAPDTNYDLALLRWGLQTLLQLQERRGAEGEDPRAARWRDILARLTPYPVGDSGYLIGRDQPLDKSHRHFSHLMMIYPLRLVTGARPGERALIERSLAHWIGFEGALQGYSFVGASAISSLLGKGEDAARYLDDLLSRFVKPNTMYLEAGPVIETPLAAAQAVHEMLLQSWGGELRVFPALPPAWKDAAFHDLRAEGAFLLSAVRRGGRTVLVRVHSLAGEPAVLRTDPEFVRGNPRVIAASGRTPLQPQADGSWKLNLARGESVLLHARDLASAAQQIAPVPRDPGAANPFGLP
jgi:alpha-L-fucosidase 2